MGEDHENVYKASSEPNATGQTIGSVNNPILQSVVKLNWFITPNQQLTATYFDTTNKYKQDNSAATFGPAQVGRTTNFNVSNLSLNYDWTISPSVLLSLKAGQSNLEHNDNPTDLTDVSLDDQSGATSPTSADYYLGGYGNYNQNSSKTNQLKADLSWFLGDHSFKFGVSSLTTKYFSADFATGPAGANLYWTIAGVGATGVNFFSTLYGNIGGDTVKAKYQSFYAQDTWEMSPGLHLIYGFRADMQEQDDNHGVPFLKFNQPGKYLQPRVGLTWDIHNDGRSKLSANYATYYEQIPQRIAIREYANQQYFLTSYLDPNAGDYAQLMANPNLAPTIAATLTPTGYQDYGTPFNETPVEHGIKLPRRDEFMLGYEQAVKHGLVFSIQGKYRQLHNPIEDSTITANGISGPDMVYVPGGGFYIPGAILWNPGPGPVSWTARQGDQNASGQNISGQTVTATNTLFPKAYNKYISWDLGLKQKLDRTYWSADYTWSHFYGNYEGVIAPNFGGGGQPDGNITAGFDYYPYVGTGNLNEDRRHSFKFNGTQSFAVRGDMDLQMGLTWDWESGIPLTKFANQNDIGGYGNATPWNGVLGDQGHTQDNSEVDLHSDLVWRIGSGKLTPSVDIFNLFNRRTPTSQWEYATLQFTGNPDVRYGLPDAWQEGRRYQFSLKYTF